MGGLAAFTFLWVISLPQPCKLLHTDTHNTTVHFPQSKGHRRESKRMSRTKVSLLQPGLQTDMSPYSYILLIRTITRASPCGNRASQGHVHQNKGNHPGCWLPQPCSAGSFLWFWLCSLYIWGSAAVSWSKWCWLWWLGSEPIFFIL